MKPVKSVKRPAASRTSHRKARARRTAKRAIKTLRAPQFPWMSTETYSTIVSRSGGGRLGLFITGNPEEGYVAGAVATTGEIKSVQSVLDHHAHHMIGEFTSLHVAMAASEEYGGKWSRRELAEADECACEDIETAIGQAIDAGPTSGPWVPPAVGTISRIDVPGTSLHHPLFVDSTTPVDQIARANVCVDAETHIIVKNRYGATGCLWAPPSEVPS